VTSAAPLSTFVAHMLRYRAPWLTALFGVRHVFVRLLGIPSAPPHLARVSTDATLMIPGQRAAFFTVRAAHENDYWLADVDDQHLWAALAVVASPLEGGAWRYQVITLVRYHNRSGLVYFTLIRPFHALVIRAMAQAGAAAH
jgi:hypothetical protein